MSAFEDKIVKNVLVIIAMEAEAGPFLTKLNLHKIPNTVPHAPCEIYSSPVSAEGFSTSVVINGKCPRFQVDNVSTVPAALTTFLAINQLQPDLIINAGTCGGFAAKGAAICDAYISTHVRNHDRRIPIPGFAEYGVGDCESLPTPNMIQALDLKTGIVSTSNSLDHTEIDDKLMLANDATCKDMEAAAVAWAANLSNTPFFAVKVVTDIVDGDRPSHEEFLENLHAAAHSLQTHLLRILSYVHGKQLLSL